MNADARAVSLLPWRSAAVLELPGGKSEANRMLALAAVAARQSGTRVTVRGATPCDDVRHMVRGLAALGFDAHFEDEALGRVAIGPRRANAATSGTIDCGNAGTTLRFLLSVAATTPGEWTLTGDVHMQTRPIEPLAAAWRALGVDVRTTNGCPPVRIHGQAVAGGAVRLDARLSSQFLSSLLLVAPTLANGLAIEFDGELASPRYAEQTVHVLARCGAHAHLDERGARVAHTQLVPPAELAVSGDWSAMGVWSCLDALTGSRVRASNLVADGSQADESLAVALERLASDGDVVVDVAPFPDQFMNLAVVAARRAGATRFVGAANLRVKECDRIAVTARELTRLGVEVQEQADGLTLRGARHLRSALVDPESDHRIAMAFALVGLLSPGVRVAEPECVAKSYPNFWNDLERVRAATLPVAIVGMRGAGKTTVARELARATQRECVDTDELFVARHGAIADFVAREGWTRFREIEAESVRTALAPGRVVAVGGGACERADTRALLARECEVVWLDATLELLRARLAGDSARPSVTGGAVLDELPALLARRRPQWAEIAQHVVSADAEPEVIAERVRALLAAPCRWDREVKVNAC
jgi:3-phosphoshikimate 1-carboxyvinyltransferase